MTAPQRGTEPVLRMTNVERQARKEKVDIALSDVAAIIVEPTQGEGGFYPAPVEFLHALRKLCDEHGIVLLPMKSRRALAARAVFFARNMQGSNPTS